MVPSFNTGNNSYLSRESREIPHKLKCPNRKCPLQKFKAKIWSRCQGSPQISGLTDIDHIQYVIHVMHISQSLIISQSLTTQSQQPWSVTIVTSGLGRHGHVLHGGVSQSSALYDGCYPVSAEMRKWRYNPQTSFSLLDAFTVLKQREGRTVRCLEVA